MSDTPSAAAGPDVFGGPGLAPETTAELLAFTSSPRSTLGVEIELGIIDLATGALVPRSGELLTELGEPFGGEHPKAKHEFYQSSIEVITGICETVEDARTDLADTIADVEQAANSRGLALIGGGLHPTASFRELLVTDMPRYQAFASTIEWPARRSMCHGIHYHVGVRSGDDAVAICRALAVYLPLFVAVSASSPYWHGYDTGLASARTKVFEGMPTTGLPPKLDGWGEFSELMKVLIAAGTIRSVRELWWDIRPHPGFGTVELRMTDTMGTLREAMSLAALAQCLVHEFGTRLAAGEQLPGLNEWVLKDNKWRACRWGADAELVVNHAGKTEPVAEILQRVITSLQPAARELGCVDELNSIHEIVRGGSGYQRQRRVFEQTGDFGSVIEMMAGEWASNRPTWS